MSKATPYGPSTWLVGARSDIFFILLAGPIISLVLLWGIWHGPAFLIGAALFALLLDIPHLLHTYVVLLSNPAEFTRHQRPFWLGLLVISTLCIGLALADQFLLLVSIWVYWQPYHVCKQHFGVATMYARKSGYDGDTSHIRTLVLAGFAAPLLYRLTHGGFEFGHYVLFGRTLPFSGLKVYTPVLPEWTAWIAYAAFAAATVRFVLKDRRDTQSGRALPRFVWIMLALSLALYNAAYLLIGDLYALILIGTSVHAIQYHLVCVSTVKSRLAGAQATMAGSTLLTWSHLRVKALGRHPLYWIGTLFVASSLVLATEFSTLGIVPLILVLHHFYLDGVIWKRKTK
jgi:hypothetical protein